MIPIIFQFDSFPSKCNDNPAGFGFFRSLNTYAKVYMVVGSLNRRPALKARFHLIYKAIPFSYYFGWHFPKSNESNQILRM